MDHARIITIEAGKRSGKPCIRGLRTTVQDVLEYLAAGMSIEQIADFPDLTAEDIQACLAFAADRGAATVGDSAGRMKLPFDQNLSHRLVALLASEFPGSAHVRDLGLSNAQDADIWAQASVDGFVITSKDADFQQRAPKSRVPWAAYALPVVFDLRRTRAAGTQPMAPQKRPLPQ